VIWFDVSKCEKVVDNVLFLYNNDQAVSPL